jgi:hypothetical protein
MYKDNGTRKRNFFIAKKSIIKASRLNTAVQVIQPMNASMTVVVAGKKNGETVHSTRHVGGLRYCS